MFDSKKIALWLVTIGAIVSGAYVWTTADWQAFTDKQSKPVEINYCQDCMTYEEYKEVIRIMNDEAKKQTFISLENIDSKEELINESLKLKELSDTEKILINKAVK